MSTINGLPAHVLFVHFIVVLAPLTAILAIICAVWSAARRRLTWLVLGLAVITAILTPLTTDAGEWLERREHRSPVLHAHTELGDTMLYFAVALVAVAALLAFVHLREARGTSVKPVAQWVIAALVIIASLATTVQVYQIGDSGAKATWRRRLRHNAVQPPHTSAVPGPALWALLWGFDGRPWHIRGTPATGCRRVVMGRANVECSALPGATLVGLLGSSVVTVSRR
jgi:hypothetical protein